MTIAVMYRLVIWVATAAALSVPAFAELPLDRPVSLDETIAYALQNHSSVRSAERELNASRSSVKSARAAYLPQVSVESSYSRRGYEGGQVGTGIRRTGDFTDRQTFVGLTQTILDDGRMRTSVRQAAAAEKSAAAELELARQERALAVTIAYYDALRAKRLADIASQAVKEADEQRNLVQARIEAGDAAAVDIYPADVQLANARLDELNAGNDVRVSANALRNAVGLGNGPELKLVEAEEPVTQLPQLEEAVSAALKERPELAQSSAQLDSQRAAVSFARSQVLPRPSASASYDLGLAGTGFDNQWFAGIDVTMNVFDGGASIQDLKGSRSRLDAIALRDEQLKKDIATEVEEARLNLASTLERLTASKTNVTLAQKNLEVAREKYKQGLAISLEVTTAQNQHSDAQAGYAEALYDSHIAKARLDKAIGTKGYKL